MAIKFPSIRPELGEVVHPDDFNLNLKQFVDEINGNLDSDNFENPTGSGIPVDRFARKSFTETFVSGFDGFLSDSNSFFVSHSTIGYISKDDNNGNSMPIVEFDAPSDGWVIIDFMASYSWIGNGFLSAEEAEQKLKVSSKNFEPFIQADIVCGNSENPPGGWMGVSCSGLFEPSKELRILSYTKESDFPGFLHNNFPQGRWIGRPIDRYAVSFRVDVNGTTISETGLLFNGLARNGVYLTGCVPVVAGKNKITTAVRAISNFALESSERGLNATFGADEAVGRFTSNVPDSTQKAFSPLPERREVDVDIESFGQGETKKSKITIGIDCRIKTSNMVVQYRKA